MLTKDILLNLRKSLNLSQQEFADTLSLTRQAVSRWETGETHPNIETLKLMSKEFNISINTLLGSPRDLMCQCCGMPLTDDRFISKESDNSYNEDYCKWCYTDGHMVYKTMDELLDFLIPFMAKQYNLDNDELKEHLTAQLSKLEHWKED